MAPAEIGRALSAWPSERFPEGYLDYWAHRFAAYRSDQVADAIDAVRMDEDPFAITCAMVEAKLTSLGIKPEFQQTAEAESFRKVREHGERIARQHAADNAVCDQLNDAQFASAIRSVADRIDADVREMFKVRGRKSQLMRSLVAEYARMHGLVSSPVLKAVL